MSQPLINQICECINCDQNLARRLLTVSHGSVEDAINEFYDHPSKYPITNNSSGAQSSSSSVRKADDKKIEELFIKYKDPEKDSIEANGFVEFIKDGELSPEGITPIIISYMYKSELLGTITHRLFTEGCKTHNIDDIPSFKSAVNRNVEFFNDSRNIKKLYLYSFKLYCAEGTRILEKDDAVELWNIFLKDKFHNLPLWLQFLEEKKLESINQDNFNLLFDFSKEVKDDFSNYDKKDCWTLLIDSFVDWALKQQKEKPS